MNVRWTAKAKSDLRGIRDYIALRSAVYARRTVDRLMRRADQISMFPLSGRVVPEFNMHQIREVIEGPYRIIYRAKPDGIAILAIIHGARENWKRERSFSE